MVERLMMSMQRCQVTFHKCLQRGSSTKQLLLPSSKRGVPGLVEGGMSHRDAVAQVFKDAAVGLRMMDSQNLEDVMDQI